MSRLIRLFAAAILFAAAVIPFWATEDHAQFNNTNLPTGSGNAGYPPGATPVSVSATATTGGIVSIGFGASPNQYQYVCGVTIGPGSATTAITISATITNIANVGTVNLPPLGAPVTAVGVTGAPYTVTFTPCLRGTGVNILPALSVGALGTGGINQTASMWGYTQ